VDREGQHVGIPLPEGSWWDWDVITWDAGQFRLAAGHDLTLKFHPVRGQRVVTLRG